MSLTRRAAYAVFATVWGLGWLPFLRGNIAFTDTLAALAAAGLAVQVVRTIPWSARLELPRPTLIGALLLAGFGLVIDRTLPVAVALVLLVGRTVADSRRADELRLLALLSLPWLATDGAMLALAFRHSAAWAAGTAFQFLGYAITRDGTTLDIEGQPLSVAAACAGIDTLHATLVAGAWLAGALRGRGRFWLAVAALPLLAWLANTLRIITLGGVALKWGADAAMGWFHNWGGISVIVVMFALAGSWVALLHRMERVK